MNLRKSNGYGFLTGTDQNNAYVVYNQAGSGVYLANGATSWSANSDLRVKKNLLPISDALEKTIKLSGYTYNYKTEADSDQRHVGVIAQDVKEVLPEAITEHDGILAVKYSELIPLLIEATKEMKTRAEKAEAKLDRLIKMWCQREPSADICHD